MLVARLGDFARECAYYFGVGNGSTRRQAPEASDIGHVFVDVCIRVLPVLVAALVLERLLDLDANRFLVLGLVLVLTPLWALVLFLVGAQSSRDDASSAP